MTTSPPTIDTVRQAERRLREEYALLHAIATAGEAFAAGRPDVTWETVAATLTAWRSWLRGSR